MSAHTSHDTWQSTRRAELLSTSALFGRLPRPALAAVADRCRPRRVPRGGFVFLEGDSADAVNILADGRIKLVRETEAGQEVILRLIQPGEIFGAAGAWGEATYPATAVALDDSVVLQLPAADFEALIAGHPALALAVVRELGARLREAEARIQELQTERVERRIARTLLRLAEKTGVRTHAGIELGVPLSRQALAELSGTTLSTASRTLSAWHRQGLISAGREQVTIRRPHDLVVIAEDLASLGEPRAEDAAG